MTSQEEQEWLQKIANGNWVWLGGRRESYYDDWQWSDGKPWDNEKTWNDYSDEIVFDCLGMATFGDWFDNNCSDVGAFFCVGVGDVCFFLTM